MKKFVIIDSEGRIVDSDGSHEYEPVYYDTPETVINAILAWQEITGNSAAEAEDQLTILEVSAIHKFVPPTNYGTLAVKEK